MIHLTIRRKGGPGSGWYSPPKGTHVGKGERQLSILGSMHSDLRTVARDVHRLVESRFPGLDVHIDTTISDPALGMQYDVDDNSIRISGYLARFDEATSDRIWQEWNRRAGTLPGGFRSTLIHEYGHAVDRQVYAKLNKISEGLSIRYQSEKKQIRDRLPVVSEYAKGRLNEWTAERFLLELEGTADMDLLTLMHHYWEEPA